MKKYLDFDGLAHFTSRLKKYIKEEVEAYKEGFNPYKGVKAFTALDGTTKFANFNQVIAEFTNYKGDELGKKKAQNAFRQIKDAYENGIGRLFCTINNFPVLLIITSFARYDSATGGHPNKVPWSGTTSHLPNANYTWEWQFSIELSDPVYAYAAYAYDEKEFILDERGGNQWAYRGAQGIKTVGGNELSLVTKEGRATFPRFGALQLIYHLIGNTHGLCRAGWSEKYQQLEHFSDASGKDVLTPWKCTIEQIRNLAIERLRCADGYINNRPIGTSVIPYYHPNFRAATSDVNVVFCSVNLTDFICRKFFVSVDVGRHPEGFTIPDFCTIWYNIKNVTTVGVPPTSLGLKNNPLQFTMDLEVFYKLNEEVYKATITIPVVRHGTEGVTKSTICQTYTRNQQNDPYWYAIPQVLVTEDSILMNPSQAEWTKIR